MNTRIIRTRISTSAISISLIACSVFWQISACIYFATSGFKADWSATPLLWMLAVILTPAICFAMALLLINSRKPREFELIEWWALTAMFLPVTAGTLLSFWAVKVLLAMVGV
jgi:hypothetical protein